ncbi:MAG: SDR family oxidoreductase [Verrucomicrobiota bacterium]
MSNSDTALITGASSGIGLHLAREFAAHGHSLVLIAPVESELEAIATELMSAHPINVRVIAKNLEEPESAREIYDDLVGASIPVDILVNNAGHGFRGRAWEIPIDQDISVVRLNIEAPLRLTKLFIQPMLQRGHGRILNTASVAGFEPGPLLAVYHATKAFLLSWSEALAIELEETPVRVTALCPGPTDTDFFPKAGMMDTRAFQKASVMAPQEVAKIGYEGLMNGELFVVPGAMNKALVAARRVLPESAQAKVNRRFYQSVPADERTRRRGDFERAGRR